jgi:hypothetical protein
MGQQCTIQLPFIAENAKCLFANLIHQDKEDNRAHPAVMNIFAPLIHQFGAMVYSNQIRFSKREASLSTPRQRSGRTNCNQDFPILIFHFTMVRLRFSVIAYDMLSHFELVVHYFLLIGHQ